MAYELSGHQYGKAESRVVRIYRDTPRHEIRDLNVTTTLHGDFADAYLSGDQSRVLPTDSQKNTAYAFAKTHGDGTVEDYGIALARHFVDEIEPVTGARISIEEYSWRRVLIDGVEHDHTWVRSNDDVRTAVITADGRGSTVIGGLKDLVILKSTGSEFAGFLKDGFTTLPETHDRIMATSLVANWTFGTTGPDWDAAYARIKQALVSTFADFHSLALQQTLWQMGSAALDAVPEITEVTLAAPNKHHFLYDLDRFGVPNHNEVFHADDRPYGLIEATVSRG